MASFNLTSTLTVVAVIVSGATSLSWYRRGNTTRFIQSDYCSISRRNTLCVYKPTSVGDRCKRMYTARVTNDDKDIILKVHNDLRRRVALGNEKRGKSGAQPPASNMRELTWDDELATMAQTWAQQCHFAHDVNRNVVRFVVGQNLAVTFSTFKASAYNWTSQIHNWFNEVTSMHSSYINHFPSSPSRLIGHYTQGVWATTFKIGCGLSSYYDNGWQPSFPYKMYYVCNYGPSGNYIDSPVYKVGRPGSACPIGTVASDGLCS